MTTIDIVVIVWVGLAALVGARRGLASQLVALAGFAAGAVIGSRVAPHLLSGSGRSPWQPLAVFVGALAGGLLVQLAAAPLAEVLRRRVLIGPLGMLDRAGGLVSGAVLAVLAAWMLALAALHQPALGLRLSVQRSAILPALVRTLPERSLLNVLATFDQLPILAGAAQRELPRPTPLPASAWLRSADASVVRVEGSACGLSLQGSGWVIRPDLVVTNAHVVAGEHDTTVVAGSRRLRATPVYVDAGEDLALLGVPGLALPALATAPQLQRSEQVVLLGYPGGGPLTAAPGSAGPSTTMLAPDAYGRGLGPRTVVPLRGALRHGDSGGPVLDRRGRVVATMFAAVRDRRGGYGVPVADAVAALHDLRSAVASGPCVS